MLESTVADTTTLVHIPYSTAASKRNSEEKNMTPAKILEGKI